MNDLAPAIPANVASGAPKLAYLLARNLGLPINHPVVEYWDNLATLSWMVIHEAASRVSAPAKWEEFVKDTQTSRSKKQGTRKRTDPEETDISARLYNTILEVIDDWRGEVPMVGDLRCIYNRPIESSDRTGIRCVLPDFSFFNTDSRRQFPVEAKLFSTVETAPQEYFGIDGMGCYTRLDGRYTEERLGGMLAYGLTRSADEWLAAILERLRKDADLFGECGIVNVGASSPASAFSLTPRQHHLTGIREAILLLHKTLFFGPQ